jgi:hypothetical protein
MSMVLSIDEVLYWSIGSIGILIVLEVIWWLGVIAFYKLAKIRQEALEK